MADREPKKVAKEETTTEKTIVTEKTVPEGVVTPPHAPAPQGTGVIDRRHTKRWVIGIVAAVVLIYILAVVIMIAIFHNSANDSRNYTNTRSGNAQQFGGRQRVSGDRTYSVSQSNSDGLTTTTTNTTYTQTQGVVTAVSGDSITVAGGGKTQVIKTNSSTEYTDNVKPVVNDTVIVVGTKDGDTITATQVEAIHYDN